MKPNLNLTCINVNFMIKSCSSFFCMTCFILGLYSCNSEKMIDNKNLCDHTNSECRNLTIGDDTRNYIIHIPSMYNADVASPLVINFHGFGGNAENFIQETGGTRNLNTVANDHNFIVVYPQGIERSKGDAEWDPSDNGISSIMDNDVFFTEKLIEDISSKWNIDPLKIYATGYSNGGMMAYGLACNRADIFAAIGIMSGTMLVDDCDLSKQTSVILFHGIEDSVLPYNGNQNFQSIPAIIDFWLIHNGISSALLESTVLNNGDVNRGVYTHADQNLTIDSYTINSENNKPGEHVWFSQSIDGKNPNDILWDFLSTHRLDD